MLHLTKTTKHLKTQVRDMVYNAPDGTVWIVESYAAGDEYQLEHWGTPTSPVVNSDEDEWFSSIEAVTEAMKAVSNDLRKWHVSDEVSEELECKIGGDLYYRF